MSEDYMNNFKIPIDKYQFDDFCTSLFKNIKLWETAYNIRFKEIRFGCDKVTLFYFNNQN